MKSSNLLAFFHLERLYTVRRCHELRLIAVKFIRLAHQPPIWIDKNRICPHNLLKCGGFDRLTRMRPSQSEELCRLTSLSGTPGVIDEMGIEDSGQYCRLDLRNTPYNTVRILHSATRYSSSQLCTDSGLVRGSYLHAVRKIVPFGIWIAPHLK